MADVSRVPFHRFPSHFSVEETELCGLQFPWFGFSWCIAMVLAMFLPPECPLNSGRSRVLIRFRLALSFFQPHYSSVVLCAPIRKGTMSDSLFVMLAATDTHRLDLQVY